MKFFAFTGCVALFGILLMINLSEGGIVVYTPKQDKKGKVKKIMGYLKTEGGSYCEWSEVHHSGLDRSLRLVCDCPNIEGADYVCEYYGNPHFKGGNYVKNAVKFYKGIAKKIADKKEGHGCDYKFVKFGYKHNEIFTLERQIEKASPSGCYRKKTKKQRILEVLLRALE